MTPGPRPDDTAILASAAEAHLAAAPDEPGLCAAVMRRGRITALVCRGLADVAEGRAVTPTTCFRLASVSKQFTAMAVLLLRAGGALDLDNPVSDWLPELPEWAAGMTLRHLLTHTSGVWPYEQIIPGTRTTQLRDADVLDLLADEPRTQFQPGEKFHYSNTGYALLACVVERASGMAFQDFLRGAVFAPLGMDRTLAFVADGPPVPERAYGRARRDDAWTDADQGLTSAVLGDGGVYSNAEDYARWDEALYGTRLVPAGVLAEAFAPARDNAGNPLPYGLGWRLEDTADGRPVVYHTGNTTGFNACVRRLPCAGVTVLAMANRTGTQTHRITRDALAELARGA